MKHLPGRKICSASGCTNGAHARGLCMTHSKIICGLPHCDTPVPRGLLCIKHGAYDVCTFGDCATVAANKTGLCNAHGARGICTAAGCTSNVLKRGLCYTHGANGRCTAAGCTEKAVNRKLCRKHDTHPSTRCMCAWDNCKTPAEANGFCQKHGAYGICLFGECRTNARKYCHGYCMKHKHHHARLFGKKKEPPS